MHAILSRSFRAFFSSNKSGSILLAASTIASLVIANSSIGPAYRQFWHISAGGLSIEQWVNDALMAVFFLYVGLELEREIYSGELSDFRNALLPIFAATGGIAVPALIYCALNAGTPALSGAGIPMATDIAFALGVLALLGSRIPASLKVFLTALAVIDDLGAIVVIAVFYTDTVSLLYLFGATGVFLSLCLLNRVGKVMALFPYLLGGAAMWFLMLKSGIHPTIAGVLLAFAIPYSAQAEDETSPSHRLEHMLHGSVAFVILPAFALANTGIIVTSGWATDLLGASSLGIIVGLVVGKPVGIVAMSALAVALKICKLPADLGWSHIVGAGLLAGIGFTMSIFIANLAFANKAAEVDGAKMAILAASVLAGVLGYAWLRSSNPSRQS